MKKKEKIYYGLVHEPLEKIDNVKLSDYKTKNISWLKGVPEKIENAIIDKQFRDNIRTAFWDKERIEEMTILDIWLYPTKEKRDIVKLELEVHELKKIHNNLINIPCPTCKGDAAKKWFLF